MADIAKNEPYLSSALSVLASLVSEVEAAGIARDRIVMLGFSQGACLTTEFAIRNASRFGGVVAFSGGAIGPPGTLAQWERRHGARFDGTPIFFGCSDVDAHVPEARVRESAERLRANGRRRDDADLSGHGPPRQRRRDRVVAAVAGRSDLKGTLTAPRSVSSGSSSGRK